MALAGAFSLRLWVDLASCYAYCSALCGSSLLLSRKEWSLWSQASCDISPPETCPRTLQAWLLLCDKELAAITHGTLPVVRDPTWDRTCHPYHQTAPAHAGSWAAHQKFQASLELWWTEADEGITDEQSPWVPICHHLISPCSDMAHRPVQLLHIHVKHHFILSCLLSPHFFWSHPHNK